MPWAEGAPSELPDALKRSNDAARVPLPVPLIVTHRAWRFPPSGLHKALQYHSPLEGESQKPSRRRRLMRWGGPTNTRHLAHQHIYTSPAVAPLEGESQKPSRQAKADAVGGPTNTRHLATR